MTRWTFRILGCLFTALAAQVVIVVTAATLARSPSYLKRANIDGMPVLTAVTEAVALTRAGYLKIEHDPALDTMQLPHWTLLRAEVSDNDELLRNAIPSWRLEIGAGWPFRCVRCAWLFDFTDGRRSEELRGGISLTPSDERVLWAHRAIPVNPDALGLSGNVLILASGLMMLLVASTATRRTLRRRRGRCPKCGYNLRGDFDNGCSECGWGRTT